MTCESADLRSRAALARARCDSPSLSMWGRAGSSRIGLPRGTGARLIGDSGTLKVHAGHKCDREFRVYRRGIAAFSIWPPNGTAISLRWLFCPDSVWSHQNGTPRYFLGNAAGWMLGTPPWIQGLA